MAYSPKTVDEELDKGFDFSARLEDGVTILSAVLTITKSYGSAAANTLTVTSPTVDGTDVLFRVSDGVISNRYLINCKANLSNTEVIEDWECIDVIEPTC